MGTVGKMRGRQISAISITMSQKYGETVEESSKYICMFIYDIPMFVRVILLFRCSKVCQGGMLDFFCIPRSDLLLCKVFGGVMWSWF